MTTTFGQQHLPEEVRKASVAATSALGATDKASDAFEQVVQGQAES